MQGAVRVGAALVCVGIATAVAATPLPFPQRIWARYEARDLRAGGELVLWVERERIWYGPSTRNYPNAMLFQPARYVEVTQVTPTEGSPPITTLEVGTVSSSVPDYYQFTGFLRLRMSGMVLKASNGPQQTENE